MNFPSIQEIEQIIGVNSKDWIANCYGISDSFLKHNIVQGQLCYGKYYGYVSDQSYFHEHSFPNHGWIEHDNKIIDPTKWVFEAIKPYIYVGKIDRKIYDLGSNKLRKALRRPAPDFNPNIKSVQIQEHHINFIFSFFLQDKKYRDTVSLDQISWIASLSLDELSQFARPLFQWLQKNRLNAFAPIDNFNFVNKNI